MHEHHHNEPDQGLLKRIRSISWANYVIGAAELTAGVLTNSSTLTMAGVHDAADGALYGMKHQAACEKDHARKQRLRRRGAMALIGFTFGIGGYEIAHEFTNPEDQSDISLAAAIGAVAAAANVTAAGVMHSKRHDHDAHDSWKHVIGVDLPGAFVTLAATSASLEYAWADSAGAAIHIALATGVGVQTLRSLDTNQNNH